MDPLVYIHVIYLTEDVNNKTAKSINWIFKKQRMGGGGGMITFTQTMIETSKRMSFPRLHTSYYTKSLQPNRLLTVSEQQHLEQETNPQCPFP